ncbi:MAG: UDP-glucose/GDP-mannose dehydrogenase family protein [Candidatus Accumulibacter sp.]|nr:UDP-glucose/GDP-mannose dehydrogenase family protein [Candidatus Accumulibacter necessarius]
MRSGDTSLVRHGIGSDPRIGTHFLDAGTGYGGSCFPKDVKALVRTGHDMGVDLRVLTAVETANDSQKRVLVDKVVARFGENLQGRSFALWGLAFKPDTDDMREAPSRVIVHELLRRGAAIRAYDPVAMDEARRVFGDLPGLSFASHQADALRDADALLIVTEWRAFKSPDFEQMRALLKEPLIFDGRNLFDPALVRGLRNSGTRNSGTVYVSLGASGRQSADCGSRSTWPGGFPPHGQFKSPD